ncbi:hypothetical protein AmDm5_3115 [Acetobacter malorum]|uniref:hypothetical protein n=1 Tax=Acetobacter persici TaxID=1076596 RepID=UPI000500944C|nr:hypothetical protein [Acetobacter persici]KFL87360.1 hypothetical protein AmDm5_3115 [Acetobacter malorum]MCG0998918.1 hypothetical protein [Acetobacter persici]
MSLDDVQVKSARRRTRAAKEVLSSVAEAVRVNRDELSMVALIDDLGDDHSLDTLFLRESDYAMFFSVDEHGNCDKWGYIERDEPLSGDTFLMGLGTAGEIDNREVFEITHCAQFERRAAQSVSYLNGGSFAEDGAGSITLQKKLEENDFVSATRWLVEMRGTMKAVAGVNDSDTSGTSGGSGGDDTSPKDESHDQEDHGEKTDEDDDTIPADGGDDFREY